MKPFVKRQKNDAADAAAIAEAALCPNLHYVAVKSAEHQARAVAFRTHQPFVGQRTQLINALRGPLAEFGLVVAQGPANLKSVVGLIDDDAIDLPNSVRDVARLYLDQIALLTQKIEELHRKLVAATKADDGPINGSTATGSKPMSPRCSCRVAARRRRYHGQPVEPQARIGARTDRSGRRNLALSPPYSPDFNPIEKAFSKLKAMLRKIDERTVNRLWDLIGRLVDICQPRECANYFISCGNDPD